jgi:DNA invertase Pin-like site-specific DNA recombinase
MEDRHRAVALYRASNKQQTGDTKDLPSQQRIVLDYIWAKEYNLVREFTESAISAFKNTSKQRDSIQAIIQMAENKEFDVLVVYHSSRLGRLAEDTPIVIKHLNHCGIKVESTSEGELSMKSLEDENATYLKYWMNENDSIAKSELIADYHLQMVKEGRFRGGSLLLLGYTLVDNGSHNFKGRPILDFVIDPAEAEVVKLIFSLSIDKGYGQQRIAKYLNENGYKSKKGNTFHSTTIQSMLANPIYKGQLRINSSSSGEQVLSPVREDLIIIPGERWNYQREITEKRSHKKKTEYAEKDKRGNSVGGKMLLNGIAVCGYCGLLLTTQTIYKTWTTKEGVIHKTKDNRYSCSSFYKSGGVKCSGQSTYAKNRIEQTVIEQTKAFMTNLKGRKLNSTFRDNLLKNIVDKENLRIENLKNVQDCYFQLRTLEIKITKSLKEKNCIETNLKEILGRVQFEIKERLCVLTKLENEIAQAKQEVQDYANVEKMLHQWAERFDCVELEQKRIMLTYVLDRVIVFMDRVEVRFHPMVKSFLNNSIIEVNDAG